MSEIDGVVARRSQQGKRTIIVRALGENGEVIEEVEHAVPQGKHLRVHKGDEVQAGEALVDGPLYPDDILRIRGEETPGVPPARDPERLPQPVGDDRRQAHRDDPVPDDAGAGRGPG